MAGPTSRLALYKHDQGDRDWHTLLNAGFDAADARFLKYGTTYADPNGGNVDGDFVGQLYVYKNAGNNLHRYWRCLTTGAGTSTWGKTDTTTITSPVPKSGNVDLEAILADYQTRINALETAVPIPPRGYIDGLVSTWDTDVNPGDLISFAEGETADSTKARYLSPAAMGKRIDQSWVPGDGNGGLSSSLTLTLGVWYHMFAMRTATAGDDFGFDTSPVAANLIADHSATHFRRIGSFQAIDSGTPIVAKQYYQYGDLFRWSSTHLDYNQGSVPLSTEQTVTLDVPPDVNVDAMIGMSMDRAYTNPEMRIWFYNSDLIAQGPSFGQARNYCYGWNEQEISNGGYFVTTDKSQQIKFQVDGRSGISLIANVQVACYGWLDPRGRNV